MTGFANLIDAPLFRADGIRMKCTGARPIWLSAGLPQNTNDCRATLALPWRNTLPQHLEAVLTMGWMVKPAGQRNSRVPEEGNRNYHRFWEQQEMFC
jgi:hypothetical protein